MKYKIIAIISFLLGGLLFGTISAYAATALASSSVSYDNSTSGGSSTNVQGAIDELYTKVSSGNLDFSNKDVLINGSNVYAQTYTFTKAYKVVFVSFQGGYSNNGKNCDMSYNGTKATAIYGSTTKTYILQNVKVGDKLYFDVEGAYPGYATVYGYL